MYNHLCVRRYNVDEKNTVKNKALMYICVRACVRVCVSSKSLVRPQLVYLFLKNIF